jgi:mRNA-degrading endonuclease RelE of RelBE toxin-antitoxin system/DNA-binding XRE family transcriptional regulator
MKAVIYLAPAQRALRRHKSEAARIMDKIDAYAANPTAFPKVKALQGMSGKRLRVGDFRVLFEEDDATIIVTDIGPRGSVYDGGATMTHVRYLTTPGGEELAILPRVELEALIDAAAHARALADHRSGRDPGLGAEEMRALLAAPTPLAFWRKKRGLTQQALAAAVGLKQNTISGLESGQRAGAPVQWLKIAKVLGVAMEDLIEGA